MLTFLNIQLWCSSQAGNACNGYRTSHSCRRWSTARHLLCLHRCNTNQFEDVWRKARLPCLAEPLNCKRALECHVYSSYLFRSKSKFNQKGGTAL